MHILAIGIQDQTDYLPPEQEKRKTKITKILNLKYNPRPNCWQGRVGPGMAYCQYFDSLGTTGTIIIYTTLENLENNIKSTLAGIQRISPKYAPKFAGFGHTRPPEEEMTITPGNKNLTRRINNCLEKILDGK